MAHAFTEGPYWNVGDVKADADVVILRTVSMDAGSSVLTNNQSRHLAFSLILLSLSLIVRSGQ